MTTAETVKAEPGAAVVLSAIGLAILALAFASIFVAKLEMSGVPALAIAFYRMALATALLLPAALALKRREIKTLARKDLAMLVIGGFCLAVHFWAWIASLKYIPIGTSVVLVNSHPLFVVLASYFFLGEKQTARSLVGAAMGLTGMLIISGEGFKDIDKALLGDALAALGAIAVVGYFIIGRKMRARVSLLGYVTPLYAICSIFLLLFAGLTGARLHPYRASEWFYFAALAIVPTILGHTVFNWAIKHVRPTAISIAFLGEPVVAAALAFIIFSQQPPVTTFIGGAFVLAGVYLTTSRS